jgi:hypothetical protein
MTNELREQIRNSFNLKETDELLDIWKTNDKVEWSDVAFGVLKEILKERLGKVPRQNEPILEHKKKELSKEILDVVLSKEEFKNADTAEFYEPKYVLKLANWLDKAALISIGISIALGLTEFPNTWNIVLQYFHSNQNWNFVVTIITVFITCIGVGLQILMIYFPLKALEYVLRVLMEMEFNSRKAK